MAVKESTNTLQSDPLDFAKRLFFAAVGVAQEEVHQQEEAQAFWTAMLVHVYRNKDGLDQMERWYWRHAPGQRSCLCTF